MGTLTTSASIIWILLCINFLRLKKVLQFIELAKEMYTWYFSIVCISSNCKIYCLGHNIKGNKVLKFYWSNKSNSPLELKNRVQVLLSKHIRQIEIYFKCSSYINSRKKLLHILEMHMKTWKTHIQIHVEIAESLRKNRRSKEITFVLFVWNRYSIWVLE